MTEDEQAALAYLVDSLADREDPSDPAGQALVLAGVRRAEYFARFGVPLAVAYRTVVADLRGGHWRPDETPPLDRLGMPRETQSSNG